ncbi:MAG TPA: hypothetical protein VHA77_10035 [Xanthobacteraceae bacterium]|nr:hypothetical protein [Xanthobacteraceae bacterium]
MKPSRLFLPALAAAILSASAATSAPLISQGIGTAKCSQIAHDLDPNAGLGNRINLMLFAWVQGYLSAANTALLEIESQHVDLSGLDQKSVLSTVVAFCKANPDKKPSNAVDEMLRASPKLKAEWVPGTVKWQD